MRHGRRRALLGLVLLATVAAACGRVIAPPPPETTPGISEVIVVPGAPIVVAARAARTLYEYGYTTRRFGSDSTWGYRANDDIAARLRYARPSNDSTRVLVELWGRCESGTDDCLRGHLGVLYHALFTAEAPPQ